MFPPMLGNSNLGQVPYRHFLKLGLPSSCPRHYNHTKDFMIWAHGNNTRNVLESPT